MLSLKPLLDRNCQGVARRELLRAGAVTAAGLSLPELLRQRAAHASSPPTDVNCIFLFLWGGPSQYETFDPKPQASSEVRGPFGAISTSVAGLQFCEHLPRLAKMAHKFATVRNMHHDNALHTDSGALAQAGLMPQPGFRPPNHGAAIARFGRQAMPALPPSVRVGPDLWDCAGDVHGQDGGFLGGVYSPFVIQDPREPLEKVASLQLPPDVTAGRLERRRTLFNRLDDLQRAVEGSATAGRDAAYERAFSLTTSPEAKRAFDLSLEPARVRERYGPTLPGQATLMARRLIEAGVRFVQVNWCKFVAQQGWDTHGTGDNMGGTIPQMKDFLLPTLDQVVPALFEDLEARGLHRNTFVVVTGEFGRTQKPNSVGGRDHWPGVYPALLFGHGVPGGLVIGQSDAEGAYPDGPHCSPEDVSMTLYRMLGLDVSQALRDARVVKAAEGIPGIG